MPPAWWVLFARLALIEDQSCREPQPLRLFETTGFQRGRYDHHHRGNFLIGLPKGGSLACLSDPVRPKTEVRCGLPPSVSLPVIELKLVKFWPKNNRLKGSYPIL